MTILKRFSQFLLSALFLAVALPAVAAPVSEVEMRLAVERWLGREIGRASCRERV